MPTASTTPSGSERDAGVENTVGGRVRADGARQRVRERPAVTQQGSRPRRSWARLTATSTEGTTVSAA